MKRLPITRITHAGSSRNRCRVARPVRGGQGTGSAVCGGACPVAPPDLHCEHRPSHTIKYSFQARSFPLLRGRPGLAPNSARRTTTTIKCSFQARSLLLQGGGLVGPSPRASREHILIVRPLRAQGTAKLPPHVSIISNRASNSCPQAVQRMQSDSTVNSSDLIPMPPQSGQRARWTL